MRPVSVFAKGPGSEIDQLRDDLHGRCRQATRAVMILLSSHGLAPAQIAELLDCHPATVRRWISRFNREGAAGLADRPRCGRPVLGGPRLTGRITALLGRRRRSGNGSRCGARPGSPTATWKRPGTSCAPRASVPVLSCYGTT